MAVEIAFLVSLLSDVALDHIQTRLGVACNNVTLKSCKLESSIVRFAFVENHSFSY